jgi:hypothetical protein
MPHKIRKGLYHRRKKCYNIMSNYVYHIIRQGLPIGQYKRKGRLKEFLSARAADWAADEAGVQRAF